MSGRRARSVAVATAVLVGSVGAIGSVEVGAQPGPQVRCRGNQVFDSYQGSCQADSDHDGLSDDQEESIGTDPKDRDTDDDRLSDGFEVFYGSFFSPPLDPLMADNPCTKKNGKPEKNKKVSAGVPLLCYFA
jgi:hypothetical protein